MKNIFPVLILCIVACSCQDKSDRQDAIKNKNFDKTYDKALKSDIIETKLISDFHIGMTEAQVDSVIKCLYEKNRLQYWMDVNAEYAPIHDKDMYTINTSYLEFILNGRFFYIKIRPEYINGKLSEMYCSIENKEWQKLDKPPHLIFAEAFENSGRGKTFKKFTTPLLNTDGETIGESIAFFKDNLEISFIFTPEESLIVYQNIPDTPNRGNKEKKDSAQDL